VVSALVSLAGACGHAGSGAPPDSSKPAPVIAAAAPAARADATHGLVMDAAFVKASPKDVLVAWYVYGGDRVALWHSRTDEASHRTEDEFDMEALTRSLLARNWSDMRAKGVAPDAYLDSMAEIEREGLMNEYVLVWFARPGWTIPPGVLGKVGLDRYRAYAGAHLVGHRAVRPVRFHPPAGRAVPEIPGATLPALSTLDPRATPCSASRARFAEALARWEVEESRLPGAPLAAADGAGFVRAIERVRAAAPFAQRGATWVGPNVADLHHMAGFCAVDEGRWADAERLLSKAAALDPLQSSSRSELAFVYTRLRRLDEADRLASEALELATSDCERARSLRQRGYVAIERGKLLEALQDYHRSLELAPGNATAEQEIKVILAELRRIGGASAKAAADYKPPPASPGLKVTACPR